MGTRFGLLYLLNRPKVTLFDVHYCWTLFEPICVLGANTIDLCQGQHAFLLAL